MKNRKKLLIALLTGLSSLSCIFALASCDVSQLQGLDDSKIHSWEELRLTKLPTCTEKGGGTCACVDCKKSISLTVMELGHDYYVDKENSIEPTCELAGKKIEICQRAGCGEILEIDVPAIGHSYKNGVCECGKIEDKDENIARVCGYLKYTLNDDGKSYSVGIMNHYMDDDHQFEDISIIYDLMKNSTGTVKIPALYNGLPVTKIDDFAFVFLRMERVVIPETILSIGDRAFYNCFNLVEIYNKSCMEIKYTGVSEENGWIGFAARNIYTPENGESKIFTDENGYVIYETEEEKLLVNYVGKQTDLIIPVGITGVINYAFYTLGMTVGKPLTSIILPNSLNWIGDSAFENCDFQEIYYKGSAQDWSEISITYSGLNSAACYYYSETEPALNAEGTAYDGNYWRYVGGVATPWVYVKEV